MLELARSSLLICAGMLVPASTAGLQEIDPCLVRPEGADRIQCIEDRWSERPFGAPELEVLEQLLETDPLSVESVASWAESSTPSRSDRETSRDDGLGARLLELHGEALFRLGRYPEAAEKLLASLEMNDGTPKLSWFDRQGKPRWSVSLDAGQGKLQRAARALLQAKRKEESRSLLARALGVGAEGWAREGWNLSGGGAVPGLDPETSDLLAPPWFRSLPELEIPVLDGEPFRLASAKGKVLLLDFWASWCAPCLLELPHLQSLYGAERERGLVALAVNAGESARTARTTAEALKLTVPIGMYDMTVDDVFNVRSLPTVILADREGRIRARWNGYTAGLERAIAAHVRDLLGDDAGRAPRPIARVLRGAGRLRVRWSKELPIPVSGLAVLAAEDGSHRVAASGRGQLLTLESSGVFLGSTQVPPEVGKLVLGDLDGDGRPELVGFRPGGSTLVVLDTGSGSHTAWNAPSTLMDVAILAAVSPEASRGSLVLGALDGLYLADLLGEEVKRLEGIGRCTGVDVSGQGSSATAVSLDSDGTLRWLDPAGVTVSQAVAPAGGWKVISDGSGSGGVGVLPGEVVAAASGDFLGDGRGQVAAATALGQLVLLDRATGEVRFRARWSGITELSAGDLDGDGQEELLVASGRSLTILEGGSPD